MLILKAIAVIVLSAIGILLGLFGIWMMFNNKTLKHNVNTMKINDTQIIASAVFNLESIIYLQGSTLTPEAHKVMVETIESLKALYK